MGLNTDDNKQSTGSMSEQMGSQRQSQQQGQAGQQQPQSRPAAGLRSFMNLGSINRAAMSRSPQAEVLTKTQAALAEPFKQLDPAFEGRLIPVDSQETRLSHSMLVVALRYADNRNSPIAFHTLILAGSGNLPPPKQVQFNGHTIEVLITEGDIYNDNTLIEIKKKLEQVYGTGANLLPADAVVVPKDLDLTDKDAVYRLTANAVAAAQSFLDNQTDRPDLNLREVSKSDATLNVRLSLQQNQPQPLNAVGQPVRNDVVLDVTATSNTQQTNVAIGQDKTAEIGQVRGFLNLLWDPVQAIQTYGANAQLQFMQQGQEPPTRKYRPQFVITDSYLTDLSSTAAQVFALLPVLFLQEHNQWQNILRPRVLSGQDIDLQDAGALNIEANIFNEQTGVGGRGPHLNIKGANFTADDFAYMMFMTIRPTLGIAMDISECGPNTWYNGVFGAASFRQDAYDELYNATDYLFDGEFSKIFARGEAITVADNNRIFEGQYVAANNQVRDLRDLDNLLAVLNHPSTAGEKVLFDTYVNSYNNQAVDLNARLWDRLRVLKEMNSTVQVTGFSRRFYFSQKYLAAVAACVQKLGIAFRPQNQFIDQSQTTRVAAGLGENVFGQVNTAGIFNTGFGTTIQTPVGLGGFGGRWRG